jgi:hypothetical protein
MKVFLSVFLSVSLILPLSVSADSSAQGQFSALSQVGSAAVPLSDGEMDQVTGGGLLEIAAWCTLNCQNLYDLSSAYLDIFNLISQRPQGTPVYTGTANSTPAYYR